MLPGKCLLKKSIPPPSSSVFGGSLGYLLQGSCPLPAPKESILEKESFTLNLYKPETQLKGSWSKILCRKLFFILII